MKKERVEKGDYYYYVTSRFEVRRKCDTYEKKHMARFNEGNYFTSRSNAEVFSNYIQRFLNKYNGSS